MSGPRALRPTSEPEILEAIRDAGEDAELAISGTSPPPGARGEDGDARAGGIVVLSTDRLDRILDLRPRDFTVTAEPGVRLDVLEAAVAEQGLWLPTGGHGCDRSIGGWVAAASPGPWDGAFGPVRRQLLACRVASYDGRVLSWGRGVVKNVAGYDVPRLVAGSRGRLGVIARVTLRLWPRPRVRETWRLEGTTSDSVAALARRLAGTEDSGSAGAAASGLADALRWTWSEAGGHRLDVVLVGSEPSVRRRREALRALDTESGRTEIRPVDPHGHAVVGPASEATRPGTARAAARARPPGSAAFRWTPGRRYVPDVVCRLATEAAEGVARIEADPARGVVTVFVDPGSDGDPAALPGHTSSPRLREAGCVVERGVARHHAWAEMRLPEPVRELEARVLLALGGRRRSWRADYL